MSLVYSVLVLPVIKTWSTICRYFLPYTLLVTRSAGVSSQYSIHNAAIPVVYSDSSLVRPVLDYGWFQNPKVDNSMKNEYKRQEVTGKTRR